MTSNSKRPHRATQQDFAFSEAHARRLEHGGSIRQGRRKLARPIDPKRPIHLVLRSERAQGALSLLRVAHAKPLHELARRLGRRYAVRIYQYANSGNHLHLLVKTRTPKGLQNFLRVFSGHAAQLVTGARKAQAFGKFWSSLAYTKLVSWGQEFRNVRFYVIRNELEAEGFALPPRKAKAPPRRYTGPPPRVPSPAAPGTSPAY